MGTRSSMGIRVNGKDKLSYCHWDGYPTGRGKEAFENVTTLIKNKGWDAVVKLATKLKQVNPDRVATPKEIQKYSDLHEQVQGGDNMYALLRGLQGNIDMMLERGIMVKANTFIKDSLFCEWAYILNVDDKTFEIYKGFQTLRHNNGRYAKCKADRGYYACALIHTIDLSDDVSNLYNALVIDDSFWEKLQQVEDEPA